MDKIKCAAYNVNGLADAKKRSQIFTLFKKHKFDIIFVSETHVSETNISKFSQEWNNLTNGKAFFSPAISSASGGVAILFGENQKISQPENIKNSIAGRCLSMDIKLCDKKTKLICVYAPNNTSQKREFFSTLCVEENANNIIMAGDFNMTESPDLDRLGTDSADHSAGLPKLKIFKHNNNLCDPFRIEFPNRKLYTYKSYSQINGINSQSRIDRFYVNKRLLNNFKSRIIPSNLSDHDLVTFAFEPQKHNASARPGEGVWKFNTKLLQDEEFVTIINNKIDSFIAREHEYPNIQEFWDALKMALKICAQDYNIKKKRRDKIAFENAINELQLESDKNTPDLPKIAQLSSFIADLERNEVDSLIFNNKLDVIESDEKPTQFFYKRLEKRKEASTITKLKNKDGQIVTDQKSVLKTAHDFYADLYNLDPSEICEEAQNSLLSKIDKVISTETKNLLERELSVEELKKSLKGMKNGRSPRMG